MPDLQSQLSHAALRQRPDEQPAFEEIEALARHHHRRRTRRLAAAGAAMTLLLTAAVTTLSRSEEPQPAAPVVDVFPEPRPYYTFDEPFGHVREAASAPTGATNLVSTPWELRGVNRAGNAVVVQSDLDAVCARSVMFTVSSDDKAVTIATLKYPAVRTQDCEYKQPLRITLPEPLGSRLLVHAAAEAHSHEESTPYPTFEEPYPERAEAAPPAGGSNRPMTSEPWELLAVNATGTAIVVRVDKDFTCRDRMVSRVTTSKDSMTISVLSPRGDPGMMCSPNNRLRIALPEPLGDRELIHGTIDRDPHPPASTTFPLGDWQWVEAAPPGTTPRRTAAQVLAQYQATGVYAAENRRLGRQPTAHFGLWTDLMHYTFQVPVWVVVVDPVSIDEMTNPVVTHDDCVETTLFFDSNDEPASGTSVGCRP